VVVIGAGSLFFGRQAIWQMTTSKHLNQGTLALVDTDLSRLERMGKLAEKVIAETGVPLKLETRVDYDFIDKRFLYGSLNLSFDYQCLVFNTEFKAFYLLDKVYPQFRVGISLGNLGMVDDFFGGK